MIDPDHLVSCVIAPVLKDLGLYSVSAENLILGTACQESDCGRFLKQLGGGPAKGIYQSEKPPLIDNLAYLNSFEHQSLRTKASWWFVSPLEAHRVDDIHDELKWNLAAATVMCRVHYLRFEEPIPASLPAQAAYWKRYYNTVAGAGTEEQYIASYRRFVGPVTVVV